MRFSQDVSHRVVFRDQGQVVENAPPVEIFGNPRIARLAEFLRNTRT